MSSISPTRKNTSTPTSKKVYVGLSGGVDSGVSAALLQQQGYDVTGAFIRITIPGYPCTAGEDRISAMRVAAHLKIPFAEIDLSDEYQKEVFASSIREFERGRTPNPDVLCNREIKFGLFYKWARAQGADLVATGHYAQLKNGELYVGADKEKDQSYFLWAVPQEVLAHTLFPIGHLQKPEVRSLAKKFGLPNAARKDSQGLCFLGPISVSDMLKQELDPVPGDVLDEKGELAGTHEGALLYTLGQRHGFTLAHQNPDTLPHYVVSKDIESNTITVSVNKFPQGASKTEITLADTNWIGNAESGPCMARYRYRQELIPAEFDAESKKITLLKPHWVPVSQSLVVYKQDACLGGGVIAESTVY
ncbi:MAG: tRNA-specific 2-thiouridylase MnmA [Candidatus Adlerbacteria bacterium]|nr:tRNA-specific 2-thiouridylase MnmA [Candidatus Adlerbacteria bacterium]